MRLKNLGNPRIRNFGAGNANPKLAIKNVLKTTYPSFETRGDYETRFNQFMKWYEAEVGALKDLRQIEGQDVIDYAEHLLDRIHEETLGSKAAKNYISGVNMVLLSLRKNKDLSIYPSGLGFDKIPSVTTINKAATEPHFENVGLVESFILVTREFGLRFEEASKISLHCALKEASEKGFVTIDRGTKGGRERCVPVECGRQIEVLEIATEIVGRRRSFIPIEQNFIQFKRWMYRVNPYFNFHAYRHLYAQVRYQLIAGFKCPVVLGLTKREQRKAMASALNLSQDEAKAKDHLARLEVAEELGHSRVEIVGAYCG